MYIHVCAYSSPVFLTGHGVLSRTPCLKSGHLTYQDTWLIRTPHLLIRTLLLSQGCPNRKAIHVNVLLYIHPALRIVTPYTLFLVICRQGKLSSIYMYMYMYTPIFSLAVIFSWSFLYCASKGMVYSVVLLHMAVCIHTKVYQYYVQTVTSLRHQIQY